LVHERPVKHVVDQRRFSRSETPVMATIMPREFHIEVLQVMRGAPEIRSTAWE